MLADVFITTKGRIELFEMSLRSFRECTKRESFRLTVVVDDGGLSHRRFMSLQTFDDVIDHVLVHRENLGLGPSINQALAHIRALNEWFEGWGQPGRPPLLEAIDPSQITSFICYCQDDLLYTSGWLERLAKLFSIFENEHALGFASGLECPEHPVKKEIGGGLLLKDWIRAGMLFGRREYWMKMFPIPRFDPETGAVRAKPSGGIGSGVDWHFIRNHPDSVCRTNRTCLVVPGLVKHLGYGQSTWLARELPESEEDKVAVREILS